MFGDPPLSDGSLVAVLEGVWTLRVGTIEYQRVGYGSYHWLATTVEGTRWFVTVDCVDDPFPVRHAYPVARRLADGGLGFVRAPRRANDGRVVAEAGRWLVSIWPWIEGRSTTSGEHESVADLAATLRCIRNLHEFNGTERVPELVESWVLSGGSALERLLEDQGWGSGPYSGEARELVLSVASRIRQGLERYEDLVQAVKGSDTEFVVTHGEPHAGNVVHTAAGPVLIDWDTLLWAPRERDLWSLVGVEGWRHGYGDAPVSSTALEVYRLQWDLSEIADFAKSLAGAKRRGADTDVALRELRRLLAD